MGQCVSSVQDRLVGCRIVVIHPEGRTLVWAVGARCMRFLLCCSYNSPIVRRAARRMSRTP